MAAELNQVKQHHHVEKPNNPLNVATVKTCTKSVSLRYNLLKNVLTHILERSPGKTELFSNCFDSFLLVDYVSNTDFSINSVFYLYLIKFVIDHTTLL